MGVYTVIAILIIVYCVGKEWLEGIQYNPANDESKVFDKDGFYEYQLNRTGKPPKGNEYLRIRNSFYITPEELEQRKQERKIKKRKELVEKYGEAQGLHMYDRLYKK